ncbi:uncharacterized protein [Choristoneura fumiferana]|uniref:uncharacterized protein n=1 Tax=Choristoneura fumiferana TaxID=7141 RepID=UPI003D15B9D6
MEICIVNILSSRSQLGSDLAIINNDLVTNNLIRKIHNTSNVKLYVKDDTVAENISPTSYIILVQDLHQLKDSIHNLYRDWYRKPNALYIILIREIGQDDFFNIFRILWKRNITNILVIINERDDEASIYSYYPYAKGGCGRDYNNTIKLCECKNVREFDVFKLLQEYDKPDLKYCTLQVGTHISAPFVLTDQVTVNKFALGIERLLIELLLDMENISWNYTIFPDILDSGHIFDNFTVSGQLGKLHEGEVDLLFGGFLVTDRRLLFFDCISNHLALQDNFITVVPKVGLLEKWKIVYIMFNPIVWSLILLSLVFCAITLSNFSKLISIQHVSFNNSAFFILFGNATQNQRLKLRKNNIFQNLIVIHWLWFIFLVGCFYQTKLTSYATFRPYKPQINEYSCLQNRNFTPVLTKNIMLFFNHTGKISLINKHPSDIKNCGKTNDCLVMVANSKNKYTVMPHLRTLWWVAKNPEQKKRIHIMHENFYNVLYGLFFKKGFPLLRGFTMKMLRIVESGFLQGFKGFHRVHRSTNPGYGVKRSFEISSLKLKDLALPFNILISGCILSLLIFIVETTHKNLYRV